MTNMLYDEVYGDRMQAFHLLDCHNRSINIQLNKTLAKLKAKRDAEYLKSEHLRHLQASYSSLLELVDNDGNPDVKKQVAVTKKKFSWLANKKEGTLRQRLFHIMAPDIFHALLEVKQSRLKDGGLGLFALTSFKYNDIITVYIGTLTDKDNYSPYSVSNGDIVLDCLPWNKGHPYLGAHMCNDPDFVQSGSIKANAKIGHTFEILATRLINPGDEILLSYNLA